ncbi:MAG: IclR family transcriptional regulator C-terminal domain-containing protein [Desulfopila sp.]
MAQRLISIKERGYDINRGDRELEVAAISAPIWRNDHRVEDALNLVGPIQRFSRDHETKLVEHLLEATRKISEMLGAANEPFANSHNSSADSS